MSNSKYFGLKKEVRHLGNKLICFYLHDGEIMFIRAIGPDGQEYEMNPETHVTTKLEELLEEPAS